MAQDGLTYADAGVDISAGDALVKRIAPMAEGTSRPGVMGDLGGFGALFDLAAAGFRDPILVAATDGVGTKLKVAIEARQLSGLGQDLVAMCVNDLACQGAEPLFFLDYFATGRLDVDQAASVIEGLASACSLAGCALIGGESAEMPGIYQAGDFDLAGFAVGAVERDAILPVEAQAGDVLLGLPSTGFHSNGFSLVRHVVAAAGLEWDTNSPFGDGTLSEVLLRPTRLYVSAVRASIHAGGLRAAAHITGGGLTENLPRVLPAGVGANVDLDAWARPEIFGWLQRLGEIENSEMLRTFNCGIGMVLVVAEDAVERQREALAAAGVDAIEMGSLLPVSGLRYSGSW